MVWQDNSGLNNDGTRAGSIKAQMLCPFCGGYAELHKQLRGGHTPDEPEAYAYFYSCASCACAGGWGKSEGTALRLWNMRPETT